MDAEEIPSYFGVRQEEVSKRKKEDTEAQVAGWQGMAVIRTGDEAFPRLDFPRSRVSLKLQCHPFKGCIHRTITSTNGALGV